MEVLIIALDTVKLTHRFRLAGTLRHSFVNGPGTRYVVFFQGCPHNCPGCQNPDTHSSAGGEESSVEAVLADIAKTKFLDGVTLSGGDPFFQPEACLELAKGVKALGLHVAAYTGWTYEQLLSGAAGKDASEALKAVDLLVDGRYEETLRASDESPCIWRGSTNQRLVDVPSSLKAGHAISYEK